MPRFRAGFYSRLPTSCSMHILLHIRTFSLSLAPSRCHLGRPHWTFAYQHDSSRIRQPRAADSVHRVARAAESGNTTDTVQWPHGITLCCQRCLRNWQPNPRRITHALRLMVWAHFSQQLFWVSFKVRRQRLSRFFVQCRCGYFRGESRDNVVLNIMWTNIRVINL